MMDGINIQSRQRELHRTGARASDLSKFEQFEAKLKEKQE